MKFALHFLHPESVHTSEIGWAQMARYSRLHLSQIWACFLTIFLSHRQHKIKSKWHISDDINQIPISKRNFFDRNVQNHAPLNPLKTSLTRLCFRTGQNIRHENKTKKTKSSKPNFVTRTFRLPPKRQLSILLIFFLFIDISYCFSSLKLQCCRKIV